MKLNKKTHLVAIISAAVLGIVPSVLAQLTKVDIYPPNSPPATLGTYTPGATSTLTSDGTGYYPNINVNAGTNSDVNATGDVMTFAYESVTGDFDRRVRITGVAADPTNPTDTWTQGGLEVRVATNHYSASFQLTVANPAGANQVRFSGRSLDGANYTDYGRDYGGVTNVLPNQWIRIRRVGNYFTAYVGTNGTTWSLIAQRYQVLPATLLVGPYALSGAAGTIATVNFDNYGATPLSDAIKPTLVSAGTLDKKAVGVKFSEPVSSATATVIGNYTINQGGGAVTITNIQTGIAADAVYLGVSGLTNNTFTVTVSGVQDTSGNTITAGSAVAAKALGWNHIDLGIIQNPASSQVTPGDDPGTKGVAVMINSDENPEVEIIGGGSNAWNPGDFIHYVYRTAPLSGNFDVTIAVSRYDRPGQTAGWANSGLMLRASPYLAGEEYTAAGTQVPMVANTTYLENSAPGRGAIPLWRTAEHGGYGNGNAGFGWPTLINGIKGYYSDLRAVNAAGDIDPQSSAESARYLRIKRVGTEYTFYASWDRAAWALVNGPVNLPTLPDQLLLGFSTMGDTGASGVPLTAYAGNGHIIKNGAIDVTDPFNPLVPTAYNTLATGENNPGRSYMNDGNYVVQRIKIFPNGVTDPLPASLTFFDIRPADGDPNALSGSWTSTGTYSFNMTGGGTGAFRNLPSPYDGSTGGDELSYAYETITGDFDKQVKVTSLTNTLYNSDGTPYDYSAPVVDTWARAGLLLRDNPTNSYAQCLKIVAGNPAGANVVEVRGRGIDAQNYTLYSRSYPGVSNAIPNQFLRMKRSGNSFSFYVSKDGVVWALVAQTYQQIASTVYFGAYCAASLNPSDATGNPQGLLSRAVASFDLYSDVEVGDTAGPVLISAGTIDKKTVGVKFSEQVNSATATVTGNYSLSQGTVTAAKVGIGGDTVYLSVSGLTANTFTVTVTNVSDLAGNKVAANSTVSANVTALNSVDIGFFQGTNTTPRTPTPGDDPYLIGTAVATSSDNAPEIEIVGGGSNAWNPGDYLHWIYSPTPIVGNFDVAVKVSRNDRPNNTAGWANSGLMLRAGVFNPGQENTVAGTKVPMVANTTYIENSAPGRAAIPLYRADVDGNYGNGTPVAWPTLVGGIKGYYTGLRAINSVGDPDPESSAFSARWLRIQRVGTTYNFLWGYDGINWATESSSDLPTLGNLLLGFSTMNDTGGGAPPFGGYAGDGHTISPTDPLNPAVAGGNIQNESNYSVQKIRLYSSTATIGSISATALASGEVSITYAGTLVRSSSPTGPWTVVPMQGNPYLIKPAAGGRQFYKVLP